MPHQRFEMSFENYDPPLGTDMRASSATTTLLHTILKNQHSITDALSTLADWVGRIETSDGVAVADSVRESLKSVDESRAVVGQCISELMRD